MNRGSNALRCLAGLLAVLACLAVWQHDSAIARTRPAGSAAAVNAQDPRVWAGVSASVTGATTNAMFSAREVSRLSIGVALVNDTDAPIPFECEKTRLVINGEPVALFDGNGPVWTEVKPGKPYGASIGVRQHFTTPGLYKVRWKGEGFASTVLEFRVTAD